VLKDIQMEISSDPTSLIPEADHLIEVIVHQMSIAFANLDRNTPQVTLRLCKHLMQSLSAFFDHKALGQAVSPAALTLLLAELTGRLLDTADKPETEAISSLSKVLNMVLIRIFHHSDQSACFRYVPSSYALDVSLTLAFVVHCSSYCKMRRWTCETCEGLPFPIEPSMQSW
jgi:cytoskeleton-associated protein 5